MPSGAMDDLYRQLDQLSERVAQLEKTSSDTESNVVGIYDKLDDLVSTVANQENLQPASHRRAGAAEYAELREQQRGG